MVLRLMLIFFGVSVVCSHDHEVKTEEDLGVKYASRCEVCKVLATELQDSLEKTGRVHDVIEIGYSLDDVQPKKKTKYQKSELRLIESLEDVCENILEYTIHKERQDSSRFAKGMSQTFKTLHGLVDKGVKVELGIPYELWDKPSAEITHLKTQCESLLEENEAAIEYWYWNLQGTKDLTVHLCEENALRDDECSCLYEDGNLKGDSGQIFDTKNEDSMKNSENSNESGEEDFQYNHNANQALESEYDIPKSFDTSYEEKLEGVEEETEHQEASKEKFAKLSDAGSINLHDPKTVTDFSVPEMRKGDNKGSMNHVIQQKIKNPNHINERPLKKPVPKNNVEAETPTEFDWTGDSSKPLPKKWVNVDDSKKDEFISKRDEL